MFDNLVRFRKVVCAKKSYTLIYKKEILFTYILFTEKKKQTCTGKKKNLCTCKIFNNPENAGENFGQTIHQYLQIVNKHTKL